jgi:glycosyltransferase involved in cell wall biosynthesis
MARKAIGKIAKNIPGFNNYLAEKQIIHQQLSESKEKTTKLEMENRNLKLRLERLTDQAIPQVRFITNQLNATGAPLVFLDVVLDFLKKYPKYPVDFHTFLPVDEKYIADLQQYGVELVIHKERDTALDFVEGDVVVLNTAGHSSALKNSVYEAIESNIVKKLVWYIQEDWPEIFFTDDEKQRIAKYLEQNKLTIFNPAERALSNIQKFFSNESNIRLLPYRIKLPKNFQQVHKADDFNKIKFTMVGRTGEGIKGHLPILYALITFKKLFYDNHPEDYRDFELRLIAIEDDLLSRQIIKHGKDLGEHLMIYPPLPHDQALDVIKNSNITICYSMRECLPVFVYEGMITGHPLLRNDVSGLEEQLEDGKNGFLLNSKSYLQVLETIEKILNKNSISNEKLAQMSKRSYEIAKKAENNSYELILNEIDQNFS